MLIRFMNLSLKIAGLAIFLTEGSHSQKGKGGKRIEIVNSNPSIVSCFLKFFESYYKIDRKRLRGRVQVHYIEDVGRSERYWSAITKIPVAQFQKPIIKKRSMSKKSFNILKNGTFTLIYHDTRLYNKIEGDAQETFNKL